MAHEITSTDNLFSVRQATWHGLGAILPEHPTREEAQALAHPWEPVTAPLYSAEPYIDDLGNPATRYVEVDSHKAIHRTDNGATLGVVGKGYQPITNNEMWDIAEAVQGSGVDVRYETAGSLRGGSKTWVLLRLEEPLRIGGDPRGDTIPYYALQNAHDGSGAFRGQAVMTRIVCANTAQVADLDARQRGTEFSFRHSKNVGERIEQAREALAGWRSSLDNWVALNEHLIEIRMSDAEIVEFLDRWMPEPDPSYASERVRSNVADARGEFLGSLRSVTNEGTENTAYGVLNAAVEYAEHLRFAQTQETRFRRSYLKRNKIVEHAAALLTA